MTDTTERTPIGETIELDKELAIMLLDLVAYPPAKGKAAHAGVPWKWIEEIRDTLDAGDGRIGPKHSFNWRRANLDLKARAERLAVRRAEERLAEAEEREVPEWMERWDNEQIEKRLDLQISDRRAELDRRRRALAAIEKRIEAVS